MSNSQKLDFTQAERQINRIARCWPTQFPDSLMEIRCIKAGNIKSLRFNPFKVDEIDKILSAAERLNNEAFEIYCTVNPSSSNVKGSVSDKDILGSKFQFADAVSEESFGSLSKEAPKPDFIVSTGTVPFQRGHFYWELNEPSVDLQKWSQLQKAIAIAHSADPSISNPSRIMRLAGFKTHPSKQKIARGYVSELVSIMEFQND